MKVPFDGEIISDFWLSFHIVFSKLCVKELCQDIRRYAKLLDLSYLSVEPVTIYKK